MSDSEFNDYNSDFSDSDLEVEAAEQSLVSKPIAAEPVEVEDSTPVPEQELAPIAVEHIGATKGKKAANRKKQKDANEDPEKKRLAEEIRESMGEKSVSDWDKISREKTRAEEKLKRSEYVELPAAVAVPDVRAAASLTFKDAQAVQQALAVARMTYALGLRMAPRFLRNSKRIWVDWSAGSACSAETAFWSKFAYSAATAASVSKGCEAVGTAWCS